jgi:PEP-CTERM motif
MRTARFVNRSAAIAFALSASAVIAGAQSYSNTTTGGPVWNRPFVNPPPACGTELSGVGTAVRYHVQPFFTSVAGSYNFLSTATGAWDNYLFLYQTSFNPATPFANCVNGNDDGVGGIGTAEFAQSLIAGRQYYLVTTGFDNPDFGAFTNRITGSAQVTFGLVPNQVVPEPSTYALMATGLVGVVGVARRRRQI